MQIFHSSRRKINLTTGIHAVFRGLNLFFQRRNWENWGCVTTCRGVFIKPRPLGVVGDFNLIITVAITGKNYI